MLNFLSQIKVEDPGTLRKSSGGGRRKAWNPEKGLAIRVWKDGSVYPSQELADQFALEYGNRPGEDEKVTGNGFDVFQSINFQPVKTPVPVIFANVVPKAANKVDLFGTVTYNEDGTPKSTVMDQGSSTFGKEWLLPNLKAVYGIELNDDKPYEDLVLLGQDGVPAQVPFRLPEGRSICGVPKEVARGERKGELTTVRRENPVMYVLYPMSAIEGEASSEQQEAELSVGEPEVGSEEITSPAPQEAGL